METADASSGRHEPGQGSQGLSNWLASASQAVAEAISTATAASQTGRKPKLRKATDASSGAAKSPEREEEAITSSFVTSVVANAVGSGCKARV
jgi:hypothetical protein